MSAPDEWGALRQAAGAEQDDSREQDAGLEFEVDLDDAAAPGDESGGALPEDVYDLGDLNSEAPLLPFSPAPSARVR